MKKILLILLILLINFSVFSQPMEWQVSGIPVEQDERMLPLPWTGSMENPKLDFVDIDGDGDYDCFIGDDTGKLWYYENIGTEFEPEWEFITDFYDSIDLGILNCPVFCDIDSDLDYDLFISEGYYGRVFLYYNLGNINSPSFSALPDTLQNVSVYPSIDLCDLDNDNDYDLIGSFNINVTYYQNQGTIYNYIFSLVDTLIQTNDFLRTSFGDLDNDLDYDFVCGVESGSIYYLRNDGTPSQYNFTLVTNNLVPAPGPDTAPTLVDIDGDGDLDMFVGTGQSGIFTPFGGIRYYENTGTPEEYNFVLRTDSYFDIDCGWKSRPRLVDIDNDGDEDLFVAYGSGGMAFYRNTGTAAFPLFELEDENFQGLSYGNHCYPAFVDLDADGDYDLLSGYGTTGYAALKLFINEGTAFEPQFVLENSAYIEGLEHDFSPAICDIDNDEDYDLFISEDYEGLNYYQNTGTPEIPHFVQQSSNYQDIGTGQPFFYDIDVDGDYDLFMGYTCYIKFYENIGTPTSANFILAELYWEDILLHTNFNYASPCFSDIDNDGDADLFVGCIDGGVYFYRNLLYNSVSHNPFDLKPLTFDLAPAYPNPFNPSTIISFTLNKALPVRLSVYNQLGQQISTIIDNQVIPGSYQYSWDAAQFSSGVYLISLESSEQKQTQKIILLK